MSEVSRLLEQSQSAHAAYRRAANPESGPPNYPLAEQHVAEAHDLLLQAHEADPNHTSKAWASLKAPYEKLIAFYSKYSFIT